MRITDLSTRVDRIVQSGAVALLAREPSLAAEREARKQRESERITEAMATGELYVSSELTTFLVDDPTHSKQLAPVLTQVDEDGCKRQYRRLELTYLAWLSKRVGQAQELAKAKKINPDAVRLLMHRWCCIKTWASCRFGPDAVHTTLNKDEK